MPSNVVCSHSPTSRKFRKVGFVVSLPCKYPLSNFVAGEKAQVMISKPSASRCGGTEKTRYIVQDPKYDCGPNYAFRSDNPVDDGPSPAFSGSVAARIAMFARGTQHPRNYDDIHNAAHVRKFNLPELLDSHRASKDERTQREVEALRTMNRVGTGSLALTRTRTFGGNGPANIQIDREEAGEAGISLYCLSLLKKYHERND